MYESFRSAAEELCWVLDLDPKDELK